MKRVRCPLAFVLYAGDVWAGKRVPVLSGWGSGGVPVHIVHPSQPFAAEGPRFRGLRGAGLDADSGW